MKKKTSPRPATGARKPAKPARSAARGKKSAPRRGTGEAKKKIARPARRVARIVPDDSAAELARLQEALREAQETIEAIRNGEVDAVLVTGKGGEQVYTLAGAEQPYRVYVERMEEGAATISAEGLILYCNQRFAQMLQEPLERVIGSAVAPRLGEKTWRAVSGVFAESGEIVTEEGRLHASDNSALLAVKFTASRLPLEGRAVMCLVATDLTAQHAHAEMRVARDVAEQANKAKDDFLAALSHELRTPLAPVLTTITELAEDAALPAPVRSQLEMMRRNVELEARLIDDLLDLTRIARGKLELRTGPVDLHAVLENAIEICSSDLKRKQQQLRIEHGAEHFHTEGDSVRLQQAMWNLIRNAVKFTPEGGEVAVRTGGSGRTFWMEVRDTGIGFEPGEGEKLFQAFEQGGRHITRQFGGLGLGLAITKSVLEAHRGSVRAESKGLGKGACFTFEMPLRQTGGSQAPMPATTAKLPARPLTILLVEDHKDTRTAMERWLRRAKHTVTAADSATQALEAAGAGTFDLVISDLGLPDLTGIELMHELRARHGLRGIAVSGYGMEEDVAKSHDAGFVHHLTKPVSLERLAAYIAQWDRVPADEPTRGAATHS